MKPKLSQMDDTRQMVEADLLLFGVLNFAMVMPFIY